MTAVTGGEDWGLWSRKVPLACKIAPMNFDADPAPTPTPDAWVWTVSDAEVRVAKRDWLRARDDDAPAEDVAFAFEYFRMLIGAQAQQIADEFRAQRSA